MTGLTNQYLRLFEYERDAHAKVVRSLGTVPAGRRDAPEFRKAVSVLAHLIASRRMWLQRFGVVPGTTGTLFPEDTDLDTVVAELATVEGHWSDFLARATDDELARTFEYKSLDAGRFRNEVSDILTQLFGHSWYHRGQIAMLVRAAGGEPEITDLIYWCREPIPEDPA
jgi:uncharacterized damage-inducible protein DinB